MIPGCPYSGPFMISGCPYAGPFMFLGCLSSGPSKISGRPWQDHSKEICMICMVP